MCASSSPRDDLSVLSRLERLDASTVSDADKSLRVLPAAIRPVSAGTAGSDHHAASSRQTSGGPYQYTISTMAPVARFQGAGQDTQHRIRRSGERTQRIRARIGAATPDPGIAGSRVQPGRQPHPDNGGSPALMC